MSNSITRDTVEWLGCVSKPVSKATLINKIPDVTKWVLEEIEEFHEAVLADDKNGMLNALVDMQWICSNFTFLAGLTPLEIDIEAEKVRVSNFSKFCMSLDEAELTVELYLKGEHPNKLGKSIETYIVETGNLMYPYVVRQKSDDKILKSYKFKDCTYEN